MAGEEELEVNSAVLHLEGFQGFHDDVSERARRIHLAAVVVEQDSGDVSHDRSDVLQLGSAVGNDAQVMLRMDKSGAAIAVADVLIKQNFYQKIQKKK